MSNNEQLIYIWYPKYKKFVVKHSLRHILPLIFADWCLLCKTPAVASQHIWTAFSTVHLFHLGNVLTEFSPFSSEMLPSFQEKIQVGTQKNEFSMACYTAWHRMMKFILHDFTLIIGLFMACEVSADIFICLPGSYFCRI